MRILLTKPLGIDRAEVLRYLRSRGEDEVPGLDEAQKAVLDAARPAAAAVLLPVRSAEDGIFTGTLLLPGRNAAKLLRGCEQAVLLGATLGFFVDRLIAAAGQRSAYDARLYAAGARAAGENPGGQAGDAAAAALLKKGQYLTPRFSPGYGDLPLSVQPGLLDRLDARRAIGLAAGESLLLSPIKSVTAVMGVLDRPCEQQKAAGCSACGMRDRCPYGKNE